MDYHSIQGGVTLLVLHAIETRDKYQPDRPVDAHADFTFTCGLIYNHGQIVLEKAKNMKS